MKRILFATLLFVFAGFFLFSCGKGNGSENISGKNSINGTGESFGKATLVFGQNKAEAECRITSGGRVQVELESLCGFLGLGFETCHRCGHTEVELGGDRIAVLWDAPYVDYMSRKKRIKLREKTVLSEGKVFAQPEFVEKCGFAKVNVSRKNLTVTFEK